jgi:3-hydroxyisobutyrate dehydrogenase-like beta-hydroxyacid dehydrogenase
MRRQIEGAGLEPCDNPADAVAGADIVLCVVTADQAAKAAALSARHLAAEALWLDMNSCAPTTKQIAAKPVESAGAIYVDVAIMAPIQPRGHATPMLAAAANPDTVLARLTVAGLHPKFIGTEIGRASTIKMLRSVMIKGMEALSAECFRAAVRAGVHDDVAASLDASEGGTSWATRASYNMERMAAHGVRRAAEMREVAKTLRDLGISPMMTTGTIAWEQQMGDLGQSITLDADTPIAEQMARIEAALEDLSS